MHAVSFSIIHVASFKFFHTLRSNNPRDEKLKQREGSSQTKTTTKRNDSVR